MACLRRLRRPRRYPDFTLIPGIEMSTDVPGNEVHVLGYFLDWRDEPFQAELTRMRDSRLDRGRRMVEKLQKLGVPVSWDRVQQIATPGAVGRPHIARALVEAGRVSSVNEAFDRYLARNAPAYVERDKQTPEEIVKLVAKAEGLCSLAHPRELEGLEQLLDRLRAAGLIGMEVYYQDYGAKDVERLLTIANKFGLLPLGGSDYHGLGGHQQREPGDIPLPDQPVQQLFELASSRGVAGRTAG